MFLANHLPGSLLSVIDFIAFKKTLKFNPIGKALYSFDDFFLESRIIFHS